MNSILKRIKDNIARSKKYTPKFVEGNIIINEKYKIVSRVVKVDIVDMDTYNLCTYTLADLENPLRAAKAIKSYNKEKDCQKIDAFYELIDPKAAEIIYGQR